MPLSPANPTWDCYNDSFRRDAHQLLAWGYEDARHKITSDSEETEITGFIAEAIQSKLDSLDIPKRFARYGVSEDKPITGENRTGKRRRRIDIIIEYHQHGPNPKYVFEAKRLCKPNQKMRDYCGKEGLLRFVDGRYAAEFPEVAMVGYMQSHTLQYWTDKLQRAFDNDTENKLRIEETFCKISVIISLSSEWVSKHKRVKKSSITIHHIFLDCF
jgi:hypothetical protein